MQGHAGHGQSICVYLRVDYSVITVVINIISVSIWDVSAVTLQHIYVSEQSFRPTLLLDKIGIVRYASPFTAPPFTLFVTPFWQKQTATVR